MSSPTKTPPQRDPSLGCDSAIPALSEKIARYSVLLGETADPLSALVGSGVRAGRLFEAARSLASRGPLRIIGQGVTIRSEWPSWLHDADVTLTELGAYRSGAGLQETSVLRAAIRDWLDRVFAHSLYDAKPSEILFASACGRLAQRHLELVATAKGIRAEVVGPLHFADPDDPLRRLLEPSPAPSRWDRVRRHVGVGSAGAAGLVATVVRQVGDAWDARPTRRALLPLRGNPSRGKLWVALVPDWEHINRHVLASVAVPARSRGELGGVLLMGTLAAGQRAERTVGRRHGTALWPALASMGSLADLALDQIVGDERIRDVVAALPTDALAAVRALIQLTTTSSMVSDQEFSLDLTEPTRQVAALATVDVFRARAAARAVARLSRSRDLRGQAVVFVGCATPAASSAVDALRRSGATSIDFLHGAGWDPAFGHVETPADIVLTWNETDRELFEQLGNRAVQAGMPSPRRQPNATTAPRRATRVLILSNYCHRDARAAGWPQLAFQNELLRVPGLLREHGLPWTFTWRPHPSDDLYEVNRTLRAHPAVRFSSKGSLESALADHDVVITSLSSTVCEALVTDKTVFVHVPPEFEGAPAYSFLQPERCFFRAEAAVQCVLQAETDPSREPEQRSRRALFGPTGLPSKFDLARILGSAPSR